MSEPGRVYLLGSSHGATMGQLFRRVLADAGRPGIHLAVSLAALPSGRGDAQVRAFAASHFPGARVERFSVEGEESPMPADAARAVLERADVVFFGGGDPILAARRLVRAGADAWVRSARARGAACVGLSAGSIALGAYWGSWPDEDPDADPEIVPCLGVVPDLVVDCHAEEDGWEELQTLRRCLVARAPKSAAKLMFAGIGHGSALLVGPRGELEWVGRAAIFDAPGASAPSSAIG